MPSHQPQYQPEKDLVRRFYTSLDTSPESQTTETLSQFCAPDLIWRGMHPFNVLQGPKAVATRFWNPLKASLTRLQRRMDVFMAGQNTLAPHKSVWVSSMGHLMGLFDNPWLGILPTRRIATLRYGEFHRIENGLIQETALFFDIPHLMRQSGLRPFLDQTGVERTQLSPLPHDALMFDPQDPAEGQQTLDLINVMIQELGKWDSRRSLKDELTLSWHDDMIWWGPSGIGSTYTIDRYMEQHARPFRAGLTDRSPTEHLCRFAEGHYGGFFGWPNFTAVPTGGFMGMPATGQPGEFRVIDIYRRREDKLVENWVFIDLLHFFQTQGVDLLARTTSL